MSPPARLRSAAPAASAPRRAAGGPRASARRRCCAPRPWGSAQSSLPRARQCLATAPRQRCMRSGTARQLCAGTAGAAVAAQLATLCARRLQQLRVSRCTRPAELLPGGAALLKCCSAGSHTRSSELAIDEARRLRQPTSWRDCSVTWAAPADRTWACVWWRLHSRIGLSSVIVLLL